MFDPKRSAATLYPPGKVVANGSAYRDPQERVQQTRHEPTARDKARTEAERKLLQSFYTGMR